MVPADRDALKLKWRTSPDKRIELVVIFYVYRPGAALRKIDQKMIIFDFDTK